MNRQDIEFRAVIVSAMIRAGMDRRQLAAALGWSYNTTCRRLQRPGSMTLEELRQLRRALRLQATEMAEVI